MGNDPPTPSPGLGPGAEVDHFRIMRPLGEGGMAEVYLARDTHLGRKVALKVVKPRALGSPDGRILAGAALDGSVRLWSVPQLSRGEGEVSPSEGVYNPSSQLPVLTEFANLEGHDDLVTDLAFSPDGRMLASAGGDRTVLVWDVDARRELALLPHYGRSGGLAFSPDSRWLATSQDDNSVRLWDSAVLSISVDELRQRVATESGLVWDGRAVVADPDRLELRFDFDHRATVHPKSDEEVAEWMAKMDESMYGGRESYDPDGEQGEDAEGDETEEPGKDQEPD